jgi:hypothetical protein
VTDDVSDPSLTILEFCRAEKVSRAKLYLLWAEGMGPRTFNIGSHKRISYAAQRAAVAMLRERGKVEPPDWIVDLNRIAAAEVDRAAMIQDRKQWPRDLARDLVGAESRPGSMQIEGKLRDAILDAELLAMPSHREPLSEEDVWPEFLSPRLPECLRRRKSHDDRLARIHTAYAA